MGNEILNKANILTVNATRKLELSIEQMEAEVPLINFERLHCCL